MWKQNRPWLSMCIGAATLREQGPLYFLTATTMPRPGVSPETEIRERDRGVPQYRVVLLDDNDHTYDYVIEMLQKLFYFSLDQAYQHAEEVDRSGRTILITCELQAAEFARNQIHGYGPDPRLARSHGSMSAVIEPAGRA